MNNFNHPALSKNLWGLIREWQHIKGMSNEELAACLKVNTRTLKSFDVSAHGLTLEKLDNLATTAGDEVLVYIFNKYTNYIAYLIKISNDGSSYGIR